MTEPFDLASLKNRLLPSLQSHADLPIASVAIIINPKDRGGAILLIKRIERSNDPWSGQIGFPGGHKSSEDVDLLETAVRETNEEVGIQLGRDELLGCLPFVTTRSRRVQVAPFVFARRFNVGVRMNEEVAGNFWLPLSDLAQLRVVRRRVHVEGGDLEVNCYDFLDQVVWGLTFRILNLLLGRTVADGA